MVSSLAAGQHDVNDAARDKTRESFQLQPVGSLGLDAHVATDSYPLSRHTETHVLRAGS